MKVVSFCIFGNSPTYSVGALLNIELYAKFLPDYRCHFYVGRSVTAETKSAILARDATYTEVNLKEDWTATMWRFQMLNNEAASHIIFRDTDSRPASREIAAVREWEQSGLPFHAMRDHSAHMASIMAGMWGVTSLGARMIRDTLPAMDGMRPSTNYDDHIDQHWLATSVWPHVRTSGMVHASFWTHYFGPTRPFPIERTDNTFIGQALDEHDNDRYPSRWSLDDSCKFCACTINCERR